MKNVQIRKITLFFIIISMVLIISGCSNTTTEADESIEETGDIYSTYFSGYASIEDITYSEDSANGEEILTLVKNEAGELMGAVSQVSPSGYGGPIEFLVVIDDSGAVVAIEIIEHAESPGLGDGIEEDSFRDQFIGKTSGDSFELDIAIDAISNATFSTKAFIEGVEVSLDRVADYLN